MGCNHSNTAIHPTNGALPSSNLLTASKRISKKENLITPLTSMQKEVIKEGWKIVSKNLTKAGVQVFTKMFQLTPEMHDYFKQVSAERSTFEKADAESLEEHAIAVMSIVDEVMSNLENLEAMAEKLRRVGKFHRTFPDFTEDKFWMIFQPFSEILTTIIGNRMTREALVPFEWVLTFILDNLTIGFSEKEWDHV